MAFRALKELAKERGLMTPGSKVMNCLRISIPVATLLVSHLNPPIAFSLRVNSLNLIFDAYRPTTHGCPRSYSFHLEHLLFVLQDMIIQRLLEYDRPSSPCTAIDTPSSPTSAVSDDFPAPDVVARVDSYYEGNEQVSHKSIFFRDDNANPTVSEPSSGDDDDDVYDYNYYFEDDDDDGDDEEKDNTASPLAPKGSSSRQAIESINLPPHDTAHHEGHDASTSPTGDTSTNVPVPAPRGRPLVVMRGGFIVPRQRSNGLEGQINYVTSPLSHANRSWMGLATRHRSLEIVSPPSTNATNLGDSSRSAGEHSPARRGRSISPVASQANVASSFSLANQSSNKSGSPDARSSGLRTSFSDAKSPTKGVVLLNSLRRYRSLDVVTDGNSIVDSSSSSSQKDRPSSPAAHLDFKNTATSPRCEQDATERVKNDRAESALPEAPLLNEDQPACLVSVRVHINFIIFILFTAVLRILLIVGYLI